MCDAVVPSAESPLLFADGVTEAVALGSVVGRFWEIQVQRAICTPNRGVWLKNCLSQKLLHEVLCTKISGKATDY